MNTFLQNNVTRRAFNNRLVLLGGYAAVSVLIPFSTSALARAVMQHGGTEVPALDTGRDEALGNYPAYAEDIGYGRAHLVADAAPGLRDTQFLC